MAGLAWLAGLAVAGLAWLGWLGIAGRKLIIFVRKLIIFVRTQWAGGCWVGSNLFPLEGVNGCWGWEWGGGASTSLYKALKVWVGGGGPRCLGSRVGSR